MLFLKGKRGWLLGGLTVIPVFFLLPGCPAPVQPGTTDTIKLQTVASGLVSPIGLSVAPDRSNRKFILDQTGQVLILDSFDRLLPQPFLDISSKMVALTPKYDERGLLGLAFHPDYATNGKFYVKYNAPVGPGTDPSFNSELHISEFTVSSSNPNAADPNSERLLLVIPKPQFNHNGGNMFFGPDDGFLYIGVGDGGGANDTGPGQIGHNPVIGNGQDKTQLLGKLLRIDVNSGNPYGIPADNPFVNQPPTRPEIFAYGLRNPYSFSFDKGGTHQLFLGDEGQNLYEEVDLITKGGDYGWNIREGFHCFDASTPNNPPTTCPDVGPDGTPLTPPIIEYPHMNDQGDSIRIAVIGGFMYRGTANPGLAGNYVFGDFSSSFATPNGSLFAATQQPDGSWTFRELSIAGTPDNRLDNFLKGIGQDGQGELYLLLGQNLGPSGTQGSVAKIVRAP